MIPAGADAHFILLRKVPGHRLQVGGLHGVHLVADEHRFKPRLLQCPAQDLRHVVAAGIVVVAADAVRVCKVGVGKAQLPDLCIHLCHAVGDGPAAEILRQQIGAVVGAGP